MKSVKRVLSCVAAVELMLALGTGTLASGGASVTVNGAAADALTAGNYENVCVHLK